MNDLTGRVAKLSPEKLSLLMQRLKHNEAPAPQRPAITRRPNSSRAPLSFAQQRVWFIDQLDTGSYAHNLLTAIRLEGSLNIGALRATVQEIVTRHEALRASFRVIDGQPVQVIADETEIPIEHIDIPSAEDSEEVIQQTADREALRPFDLSRGPMLRLHLARIDERHSVLLLAMHHIVGDGWSRSIFAREFASLYADYSNGRRSSLPPVAVQYPDYAAWQRQWPEFSAPPQQLAYWKKQFERPVVPLDLPIDFVRPRVQTFRGRRIRFQLGTKTLEALNSLAKSESATMFMALLTVFQVLLSRYSRHEDIVTGSAVANRSIVEAEGTIGFFANTIALRTDLSGNPTFRQALQRVRTVCLGAYANQEYPFERLVQEIRPERDLSRTPLFQVMFLMDNTATERLRAGDVVADLVDFDARISPFHLSLHMEERLDGLHGGLEYNTDLFGQPTIEAMIGAFRALLAHAIETPEIPIRELRLTSEVEQPRGEAIDAVAGANVLRLIVEQAADHPMQTAIADGERMVSYAELVDMSEAIACSLSQRGIGGEDVVALWGERRVETIAAMIGILRAGAAWLPLEPSLPLGRIKTILADAGVRFIASCGDRAPRVQGYTTIDVSAAISAGGSGSPPVESGGDRLAYVIYTSGSTGAPKGVQISHLALAYYTAAAREAYRLDPGDRVLQFASLGFDASVEEIFPTLTAGATLVLGGEKMLGTTRGFVDASRKAEITVWPLPTAFWSQMVNEIAASKLALPATLRLCILGGERVDPERWTLWKRVAPARIALVNTYGPTEATVVATLHDSNTDASGEHVRREVPIGPTLRGSDAFVLDDALQPLPRGAPGELYLAGPNLSRGYRNDPASTARAFVPNPFASMPGRRMYRTGDIARMLSNGGLEYLGRADSQVKLRGHRVELTEIESVMKECADVSDAAVCVSGDGPSARLIAGIVPRDDAPIDPNSIRTHVRGRLPEFMTPSVFITLDRIPLNRNGKVDRAALAAQTPTLVESAVAAPPATVAEIRMAAIWSRLLNVANPLLDDSFFESGGHSLLATAMVNEISREFGVALTLRQVFEHSTLRSLAQLVEAAQPAAPAPAIPSIETASAAALLGMLDELSEEEVERALARMAASESSVR